MSYTNKGAFSTMKKMESMWFIPISFHHNFCVFRLCCMSLLHWVWIIETSAPHRALQQWQRQEQDMHCPRSGIPASNAALQLPLPIMFIPSHTRKLFSWAKLILGLPSPYSHSLFTPNFTWCGHISSTIAPIPILSFSNLQPSHHWKKPKCYI